MGAVAHGLHFVESGEAYIFEDQFEHLIKLPIPKRIELQKELTYEKCGQFFRGVKVWSYGANTDPEYKPQCEKLPHYYDKSVEEFQDVLDDAFNEFDKKIRTKRFVFISAVVLVAGAVAVPAVIGGVTGAIAGHFTAKHYYKGLESQVTSLEKDIVGLQKATRINSDILYGLTNEVVELEKRFDDKIKLTNDNINSQMKLIEDSFKLIVTNQNAEKETNKMANAMKDFSNSHLSSLRTIMNLELDKLEKWEKIISKLTDGRLPSDLIGYNTLKGLLKQIEDKIPKFFELALKTEDFPLYFTLPLTSHIFVKVGEDYFIYVHLRIPLKMRQKINQLKIITPQTNSFP